MRLDEALNAGCVCASLDAQALERALAQELGEHRLVALVKERCPHLFSAQPIFVSSARQQRMERVVRAIESVVAIPAYREEVLSWAPAIARFDPGTKSVFFGYDFHVAPAKLGLIEINTNAGGAMLNLVLARAQQACCDQMQPSLPSPDSIAQFAQRIVSMFRNEWRLSGRPQALRTIAIVDEAPAAQYLYAEFLLFQRLFERHGIRTVIADPTLLSLRDGILQHGETPIDLVYNRLTDFALEGGTSEVLRDAYLQRAVVLTPHPRAHALYADKRNLALLGNARRLSDLGVPPDTQQILLEAIPRTEQVDAANADRQWRERRGLFFKPSAGFGSRAAYRGDKLTKRVWQEILAGSYIAQEFIAPGERAIAGSSADERTADESRGVVTLKFDLRNYVYDSSLQWMAARLYRGQTTNFRTPGGGFAPVYAADALIPAVSFPG